MALVSVYGEGAPLVKLGCAGKRGRADDEHGARAPTQDESARVHVRWRDATCDRRSSKYSRRSSSRSPVQ